MKAAAGVRAAGPRPKVKPPVLRAASFEDYPAIAALQQANGLECKPREEWEHLWTGNPALAALPGWTMGWILEDDSRRVVGSIGSIPFHYHLGGARYVGATACGWAVDPAYRGFSIALLSAGLRQPGVDLHVTTTPGEAASAVFGWLGFTRPPVGQWDRAALWVKNVPGVGWRRPAAKAWPPRKLRSGVELECRREFGPEFDRFWEEFRNRNPHLLLSSRASSVLEWHYRYAMRQDRLRIAAAYDRGRLAAYAILVRRDTGRWNLRRALLADYLQLEPQDGLCRALIAYAGAGCRREGVHVIENVGCWIEGPGFLNRRAPFHRVLKAWTYLYSAPNQALHDALRDPSRWFPTQYDGDATL